SKASAKCCSRLPARRARARPRANPPAPEPAHKKPARACTDKSQFCRRRSKAAKKRTSRQVRFVGHLGLTRCNKMHRYSITSSAAEEGVGSDEQRVGSLPHDRCEGRLDFGAGARVENLEF